MTLGKCEIDLSKVEVTQGPAIALLTNLTLNYLTSGHMTDHLIYTWRHLVAASSGPLVGSCNIPQ